MAPAGEVQRGAAWSTSPLTLADSMVKTRKVHAEMMQSVCRAMAIRGDAGRVRRHGGVAVCLLTLDHDVRQIEQSEQTGIVRQNTSDSVDNHQLCNHIEGDEELAVKRHGSPDVTDLILQLRHVVFSVLN